MSGEIVNIAKLKEQRGKSGGEGISGTQTRPLNTSHIRASYRHLVEGIGLAPVYARRICTFQPGQPKKIRVSG